MNLMGKKIVSLPSCLPAFLPSFVHSFIHSFIVSVQALTKAIPDLLVRPPKEVPLWVIILAAIGGILLLIILIIVLWKVWLATSCVSLSCHSQMSFYHIKARCHFRFCFDELIL